MTNLTIIIITNVSERNFRFNLKTKNNGFCLNQAKKPIFQLRIQQSLTIELSDSRFEHA